VIRRGFTLIETMVSLAIVGFLASVAIPGFQNLLYQSKRTERAINVENFGRAVIDYMGAHEGRLPANWDFGAFRIAWALPNPAMNPVPAARAFDANAPIWSELSFQPDGRVRYSYELVGEQGPGYTWFIVYAYGDLDGDHIIDQYYQSWTSMNGSDWVTTRSPDDHNGPY